jgi:hypothetical protein
MPAIQLLSAAKTPDASSVANRAATAWMLFFMCYGKECSSASDPIVFGNVTFVPDPE